MMKRSHLKSLLVALSLASLALGGAACGDDGGGGGDKKPPKKKRNKKRNATKAKKGAAAGGVAGMSYVKIDEELRHPFTESDFIPDPDGEKNRDPFRSWVLRTELEDEADDGPRPVDPCTEGNVRWGAENYSVRDLELVGLVKRGRSFAQFTDKSDKDSWIVRKGDCIGQEKAVIEEIGVGYVRLSITPEAPPGAPAPAPQKQDIPLHPEELELPDALDDLTGE